MTNELVTNGLFGLLFRDPEVALTFGPAAMLGRMVAFEVAWTEALVAEGIVGAEDGAQAVRALEGFDPAGFRPMSDVDGLPVPSFVAQVRAGLPAAVAGAIHTGATSQDVLDTAIVLTCLEVIDILAGRLDRIEAALDRLERQQGGRPLMARTRMQAALPATASLRLAAWRRLVRGRRDQVPALRHDLGRVQAGGAVGSRALPFGKGEAVAGRVAQALGLRLTADWQTDRSSMVGFGHWLTLVSGGMGKIGQDIALMAQQGLDEIALSGGGTSSAMPHKSNPVAAEIIVALSRHVSGLQGTLSLALVHEQERSGTAWALEWLTLPAMAEGTGAALAHAERLIASVSRIGTAD